MSPCITLHFRGTLWIQVAGKLTRVVSPETEVMEMEVFHHRDTWRLNSKKKETLIVIDNHQNMFNRYRYPETVLLKFTHSEPWTNFYHNSKTYLHCTTLIFNIVKHLMFGPYNHDMIVCIKRQIRMHESYHFFTNLTIHIM